MVLEIDKSRSAGAGRRPSRGSAAKEARCFSDGPIRDLTARNPSCKSTRRAEAMLGTAGATVRRATPEDPAGLTERGPGWSGRSR